MGISAEEAYTRRIDLWAGFVVSVRVTLMQKVILALLSVLGVTLLIVYIVRSQDPKKEESPGQPGSDSAKPSDIPEQASDPQNNDPLPLGAMARLGSDRFRHYGHVTSLVYSPDGKLLVSGGLDDATVRIWNAETGQLLHLLRSHKHGVASVVFSPDGKQLASAGGSLVEPDGKGVDCAIRIWDCSTWKEQRRLEGHPFRVHTLAFAPNGKTLASGGKDGTIRLWNPATGASIDSPGSHDRAVLSLAFSPDSNQLASGGTDHMVRLWDLNSGQSRQFAGHTDMVKGVVFAPDGKELYSSGWDGDIRVWNVETGESTRTIAAKTEKSAGIYRPLAISPDGEMLAGAGDGDWFCLWETRTGKRKLNLSPNQSYISAVAFAPDEKTVAAISSWGALMRVRLPSLKEIPRGGVHQGTVSDLAFSPDGKLLATACQDHTVWLWDVAARKPLRKIKEERLWPVDSIAFSPDGSLLAGRDGGGVSTWEVESKQVGVKPVPGMAQGPNLAFLPGGKEWITNYYQRIRHQTAPEGKSIREFEQPEFSSQKVIALSPDGTLLAGGAGYAVTLCDMKTGKVTAQLKVEEENRVEAVIFSPDGRLLASAGDDGTIRLWNVAEKTEVGRLEGFTQEIHSLAFSPDGKWLASGGHDWLVRVWDVAGRKEVRQLAGHTGAVKSVRFSPDGKLLASGSTDSTILLWDTEKATSK